MLDEWICSRDGLSNTGHIVASMPLCPLRFVKRVDVLATHKQGGEKDTRKLWEVLAMSISLIAIMLVGVFAYIQTHQIIHIKYVHFLYINYT